MANSLWAEKSLEDEVQDQGNLPENKVVEILIQIVTGLDEVRDIIHRDLKPDNVLLHKNKWKIADFGIARFVEESTSLNTLKGYLTPPYAAPEQWKMERATHATDVYALGCIGYKLLWIISLTSSKPVTICIKISTTLFSGRLPWSWTSSSRLFSARSIITKYSSVFESRPESWMGIINWNSLLINSSAMANSLWQQQTFHRPHETGIDYQEFLRIIGNGFFQLNCRVKIIWTVWTQSGHIIRKF